MQKNKAAFKIEIGPSGRPLPKRKSKPLFKLVEPYLYLLPTFILIGTFQYLPFLRTVLYSFSQVSSLAVWRGFVGFQNYLELLLQPEFPKALLITAKYLLMYVPGHIFLAISFAFMANNKRLFSTIYQTMYAMSMAVSMSAACLVFRELLSEQSGILNWVLVQFGLITNVSDIQWFATETWALQGIVLISLWSGVGFHFMLLLAAIRGVPQDLMENANLAGANWFQRSWHIIIPTISPTMFFVIVTTTITALSVVTPINILTPGGGPNGSTMTLMFWIFQQGYRNQNYMYGSAGSIILFFTTLAFTLINFMYEKKKVFYG